MSAFQLLEINKITTEIFIKGHLITTNELNALIEQSNVLLREMVKNRNSEENYRIASEINNIQLLTTNTSLPSRTLITVICLDEEDENEQPQPTEPTEEIMINEINVINFQPEPEENQFPLPTLPTITEWIEEEDDDYYGDAEAAQERMISLYNFNVLEFVERQNPIPTPHLNTPLEKVCSLSKDKFEALCDNQCSICYETHKTGDSIITDCNHQFGNVCFTTWSNSNNVNSKTCPCCRKKNPKITSFKKRNYTKTPKL
jgi:hypothetical protein